ncbi:hypothetical protein DCCM_3720 [Desulfocucumis palustris]|uniref:Uncharacterized protein n=1 Tax=Desulfocucumis palustris TaxID=1898651 RepID=A0A2L2XKZ1_9FIRM|nr:hypothetical protein DCCM_3720 [Desulfocucumis palustris]
MSSGSSLFIHNCWNSRRVMFYIRQLSPGIAGAAADNRNKGFCSDFFEL